MGITLVHLHILAPDIQKAKMTVLTPKRIDPQMINPSKILEVGLLLRAALRSRPPRRSLAAGLGERRFHLRQAYHWIFPSAHAYDTPPFSCLFSREYRLTDKLSKNLTQLIITSLQNENNSKLSTRYHYSFIFNFHSWSTVVYHHCHVPVPPPCFILATDKFFLRSHPLSLSINPTYFQLKIHFF